MMATDFDEYEYLEKAVEVPKDKDIKDRDHRSSVAGEKDRHRDRDRDRERDRDKKKDRDHEHERERDHRSNREKGRDRERDRERERDRDRERERRSSSRSRREREMEKEMMERARSRERREREREPEKEIFERENRRFKDKKENVEPEVDPERDQRTVFAYQMPLKASERDVYEFFSKAGKVRDVRIIMDRSSRRSKGVGYIEFYDATSVPMAIALSGQMLLGQPVMVKPSEAEKNLVQSTAAGASGVTGAAARKLYVGNLHFSMTEEQLRLIFEPFGPVELLQLPLDLETGQCRGYGFVQFAQLEHAKAAQTLNGKLEIAGRVLKVSAVTDHVGVQESGANTADFDDEDGGALSLNARSRAILMQKLDRTGIASSIAESLGVPGLNGAVPTHPVYNLPINGQAALATAVPQLRPPVIPEPVGDPSECILLKNMFDPSTETEPDFDLDIKEDVHDECSKFGNLKHIYVDKNSNGCVYLHFESVIAATNCQRAMHGRWFAGRSIVAKYMKPEEYEAQFNGI